MSKNTKFNTLNLASGGNGPFEYISLIKNIVKPVISNSNEENKVILIFYDNYNLPFDKKSKILLNSSKPILFIKNNGEIGFKEEYITVLKNVIKKHFSFERSVIKANIKVNANSLVAFKGSNLWRIITLHPIRSLIKVAFNKIFEPTPSLS